MAFPHGPSEWVLLGFSSSIFCMYAPPMALLLELRKKWIRAGGRVKEKEEGSKKEDMKMTMWFRVCVCVLKADSKMEWFQLKAKRAVGERKKEQEEHPERCLIMHHVQGSGSWLYCRSVHLCICAIQFICKHWWSSYTQACIQLPLLAHPSL